MSVRKPRRYHLVVPLFVALAAAGPIVRQAQASPQTPPADAERRGGGHVQRLADDQARAIAIRFAPRFRFHPDEAYLPVHPLFVLETAGQERPQGLGAAQELGSPADRIRRYLALTLTEKSAKAKVFYDVYRDERQGPGRIVVEYWLYFVDSRYRTKRGFFPFSLDTSHPNDLEHVFLILAPRAGSFLSSADISTGLGIERIVANVHDGRVPNHVTPIGTGARVAERPLILVELGSHALAPDVDGDGYVRTNVDVEPSRITWGLRDTGRIWAWRSPDDAQRREASASTTLRPSGGPGVDGDRTYELEPVGSVDAAFRSLALAPAREDSAFGGQVNPFLRLFGKSDGGSPALRRPSSNANHGDAGRLLNDSVERQRGLSLGFTNTFDSYTLMLGGRLPLATPRRPWPALTADIGVVFPSDGPSLDAELLASYEIDTQVDLIGGAAWLANSSGEHQTDWLAGLQVQLGRLRLRGVYRRGGAVNDDQADFRIQYDFWK
jgi:hypothetical protein